MCEFYYDLTDFRKTSYYPLSGNFRVTSGNPPVPMGNFTNKEVGRKTPSSL